MKMDPVEFILKNMTRKSRDERAVHQLHARRVHSARRRALRLEEALAAAARIRPRADQARRRRFVHGVPIRRRAEQRGDRGSTRRGSTRCSSASPTSAPARRRRWGMIAAEELGVPLSQVTVVWGDTDRCPYSVGESGSRTTIMTGYAVIEAARDLKKQIAEKGMPTGGDVLVASATPQPALEGKVRDAFGAHFVEVEVDTELGRVRVTKYVAVHDCGRIMNPLTATSQIQGARDRMGIGMALHENLLYDRAQRSAAHRRLLLRPHSDSSRRAGRRSEFIESDDGYGPCGAKSMGESGNDPVAGRDRQRGLQRDRHAA